MLTAGPSSTRAPVPLFCASSPIAVPTRRTRSTSHVEARIVSHGNAVAGPFISRAPPRTPWPASDIIICGTPSRGIACVVKPVPDKSDSFSSWVSRPNKSFTRSSIGARASLYRGASCASAVPWAAKANDIAAIERCKRENMKPPEDMPDQPSAPPTPLTARAPTRAIVGA